jgi:hypothetical protein
MANENETNKCENKTGHITAFVDGTEIDVGAYNALNISKTEYDNTITKIKDALDNCNVEEFNFRAKALFQNFEMSIFELISILRNEEYLFQRLLEIREKHRSPSTPNEIEFFQKELINTSVRLGKKLISFGNLCTDSDNPLTHADNPSHELQLLKKALGII